MSNIILIPFGILYSAIVRARHALYEKKILKSQDLQARTISIGNITVGGTGKTPTVAFVAKVLAENGEKVCVLTRGYGRANPSQRVVVSDGEKILSDVRNAGDEPFELATKLIGISVVIADANRAEAAKFARENFGVTAFVLDDAFQHFQVERDLDIVLVDATNPFGNRKILPAGILREGLENLNRADVIVITRANLVKDVDELKTEIKKLAPKAKIFVSENKISSIEPLKGFGESKEKISETRNLTAFCALGNPENFFAQLRLEGFNLTATKIFPDHYFYSQKDIEEIENLAKKSDAEILMTTGKDAGKAADLKFDLPCFVAENKQVFDDEKSLREIILKQGSF